MHSTSNSARKACELIATAFVGSVIIVEFCLGMFIGCRFACKLIPYVWSPQFSNSTCRPWEQWISKGDQFPRKKLTMTSSIPFARVPPFPICGSIHLIIQTPKAGWNGWRNVQYGGRYLACLVYNISLYVYSCFSRNLEVNNSLENLDIDVGHRNKPIHVKSSVSAKRARTTAFE